MPRAEPLTEVIRNVRVAKWGSLTKLSTCKASYPRRKEGSHLMFTTKDLYNYQMNRQTWLQPRKSRLGVPCRRMQEQAMTRTEVRGIPQVCRRSRKWISISTQKPCGSSSTSQGRRRSCSTAKSPSSSTRRKEGAHQSLTTSRVKRSTASPSTRERSKTVFARHRTTPLSNLKLTM